MMRMILRLLVLAALVVEPGFAQTYPVKPVRVITPWQSGELKRAIESPDTQKRMEELEPCTMTPSQMAARIQTDYEKYGKLLKLVGGKID